MAFLVIISFNVPIIAFADDAFTSESTAQSPALLNESFIEYDYETKTETTFTYADVVNSLQKINPEYTDYTTPFSCNPYITDNIANGESTRTIQPGSTFNLIDEYVAPYTYTMRIQVVKSNGNSSWGTGFMVSKYVMLTCAHVVWGDDVEEIKIYPYNNETITSLDNETYYHPRTWAVSSNYTNATDSATRARYDWCYLTLHQPLGEDTGYFSFATISDNVSNAPVSLTGYPGNNTQIPNFQRYAQYMSQGTLSVLNTQRVTHSCSSLAGQSGSPVYLPGNIVIAVHTGGGTNNYGVRITTVLYNLLTNKINQVG